MLVEKITRDTIVRRRGDLSSQEIDGDIVMADIQAGQFYGLGSSAKRIWELLAEPKSPASLCACLLEEYEVDPTECEVDVLAFVNELLRAGLIRIET